MLTFGGSIMASSTINIAIPEAMKAEVEEVVATEGYGNTSEFFRDLFRQYQKARQERQLEALLLERLRNNEPIEFDIKQVKAEFAKRMLQKGKKTR